MTKTPMEQIAYWISVTLLCALTTAVVLGLAGYLYFRFFA